MWAIISVIEGNIAAYEAVLVDIKRQRVKVEELYILGDIVAANPDSETVIKRIQNLFTWRIRTPSMRRLVGRTMLCFTRFGFDSRTDRINRSLLDTVAHGGNPQDRAVSLWQRNR